MALPCAPKSFPPIPSKQTGYKRNEVLGRNCRFLQGARSDPTTINQIRAALRAKESVSVEIYNYRHDGRGFWNALYICPIFDIEGKIAHFFSSQLDITLIKEAEFRQRENVDAVGSLASGAAHTINNLMTVVLSSIRQAARQAVDGQQSRRLARADEAARSAGRLTQQMLSFARRQFLDADAHDLNMLVSNMDDLIRQIADKQMVGFIYAAQPAPAWLDARQFELALIALVRNASDASAPSGRIAIKIREYTAFEGRLSASWVELSITDDGTGMDAETLQKAAQPFFTTKIAGTGLGLPMVAGYAEQSGGRMIIESEVGTGTIVRISFPKHTAQPT